MLSKTSKRVLSATFRVEWRRRVFQEVPQHSTSRLRIYCVSTKSTNHLLPFYLCSQEISHNTHTSTSPCSPSLTGPHINFILQACFEKLTNIDQPFCVVGAKHKTTTVQHPHLPTRPSCCPFPFPARDDRTSSVPTLLSTAASTARRSGAATPDSHRTCSGQNLKASTSAQSSVLYNSHSRIVASGGTCLYA